MSANEVYTDFESSLFQIRIMEQKSGSRASLGSGFLVADGRHVVTNYHVVSGKVMDPQKYRIEVEHDDHVLRMRIHAVDAVNDLALLTFDTPLDEGDTLVFGEPFAITDTPPQKGEKVYSLGNPHDIGMTVVEGNYNGLVDKSFLDRIHFSGAINSGMSGGPAVNASSEVIGVNVATAGNQIGFLVPVDKVANLLKSIDRPERSADELYDDITQQIGQTTTAMIDEMLSVDWPTEPMGEVNIVGQTVDWVDCWGNSDQDDERRALEVARGCNNGLHMFVSHRMTTAHLEYEFFYFEAPTWPTASVYHYMGLNTANAIPANRASKKLVDNYTCLDDIVTLKNGMEQRISYCTRPYLKFKGLYDTFYIAVSTDKTHQVAMSHFTLSGVTKDASYRFLSTFMEKMAWR